MMRKLITAAIAAAIALTALAAPASAVNTSRECTVWNPNGPFAGDARVCARVHWRNTKGKGVKILDTKAWVEGDAAGFEWIDCRYDSPYWKTVWNCPHKDNTDKDAGWGANVQTKHEKWEVELWGRVEVSNGPNFNFRFRVPAWNA